MTTQSPRFFRRLILKFNLYQTFQISNSCLNYCSIFIFKHVTHLSQILLCKRISPHCIFLSLQLFKVIICIGQRRFFDWARWAMKCWRIEGARIRHNLRNSCARLVVHVVSEASRERWVEESLEYVWSQKSVTWNTIYDWNKPRRYLMDCRRSRRMSAETNSRSASCIDCLLMHSVEISRGLSPTKRSAKADNPSLTHILF